ncbi:ATP-dependent acyl-CoA ligase [Agrobacterium pusense]|uniref:ATP-dependent acyl-CoA ligase n=1 Tax=Agrobacterium pusense TaxID=648995 RepID=UPI00156BC233|nr:ATP-dependent acyl-CoA ligase [Agrobacterium pusense]QKJ94456.1 ATP-dependent acyl-CoA ligase [Agrobacterium pusense]
MTSAFDPIIEFSPSLRTVPALLERQVIRHPDCTLFSCQGTNWTFREALEQATCYASTFISAGVKKGDRVAVICSNRPEFMSVFLGCAWMGAVSVPINTASRGFQLQHILSNSKSELLVIEEQFLTALDGIDFSKLDVKLIWVVGKTDEQSWPAIPIQITDFPKAGEAAAPASIGPGDPLTILYTSGTTGLSKGVICPHGQFFWWGVYTGRQLGVKEGDILHTPLPLFHTNALNSFFQALIHGSTQVVEAKFSVSQFWPVMAASGATVTYLLGAMVPMLLSKPATDTERNHSIRVALAPGVPQHASEEFHRRTGIILLEGYGTTESNAVIGSTTENRKAGWVGCLVDGFEAMIVDDEDNPLPDGHAGELLLRAREPHSMSQGYYGMPEKTVEVWRNLWLHTGDRMVRDTDGFYRFVDRMKDAIRRRGENISSYEVEQVLIAHPAVAIAAVFPVASELAEDEVMAAIVLREGHMPSQEEIVRFCEGKMSYFAIPRFIDFLDDMPRTENGKVQKFRLRERGRSENTWDREAAGMILRR